MKTHVNLLNEDERRDPGVMVLRRTLNVLAMVALIALVLYGLHAVVMLRNASGRLRRAEAQWRTLEADNARAVALAASFAELTRVRSDLAAFSNVQIVVGARLHALARAVPPEIQLTEVSWSQDLVDDTGAAARQYAIAISGRTPAMGSEAVVKTLIDALRVAPESAGFGTVTPGGMSVDPKVQDTMENIFTIRCLYAPRRYL